MGFYFLEYFLPQLRRFPMFKGKIFLSLTPRDQKCLPKFSFQLYSKTNNSFQVHQKTKSSFQNFHSNYKRQEIISKYTKRPKLCSKGFPPIIQQDKKCRLITQKYPKFLPIIQQDKNFLPSTPKYQKFLPKVPF
jgi:hypothetical protein